MHILYGTAWKKERTAGLVLEALKQGFRGIDTACQPRHYNEPGVGEAIRKAAAEGISRDTLFIQTKYTPATGQDMATIPYDPKLPLAKQVQESIRTSKANLGIDVIDSLILHSPLQDFQETIEVWKAFEDAVFAGQVKEIGISNCYSLEVLQALYQESNIKPRYLQNRFYRETQFDIAIRKFCKSSEIQYQSFWTLTANPDIVSHQLTKELAEHYSKTPQQIFFRYLNQIGILPLSGTTNPSHMHQDLAINTFELSIKDCELMNSLGPFV